MDNNKLPVGISSCLLGQQVRFDGGHKKNNYIVQTLGEYFDFQPFCPEVGAGLGIPRPTIRLVQATEDAPIRAVEVKNQEADHTAALQDYSEGIVGQLQGLCGYILKKDSPSCGMERVKIYRQDRPASPPERNGSGIYVEIIRQHYPYLPMEEEGRLCDPILRENFVERVFVYHRWQQLEKAGITPASLVDFHSTHKYSIMAHNQAALRELGQLVAQAGKHDDFAALCQQYFERLMIAMAERVSRGQHANVLQHLMGYISADIDKEDRAELVDIIARYQQGYVPLIVPLTLLNHHFRRHPHPYISRQHYLNPHPSELMLRNQL
ncbi:MAG: YbgA family protein [Thiolinea sp.]